MASEDPAVEGDEKKFSHSIERKRIRNEIVETETKYCACLKLLEGLYVNRLQKEQKNCHKYDMQEKTFTALIMNLPTLVPANAMFLEELADTDPLEVATVLNKYADIFKMYTDYTNGFEVCMQTITHLKKTNKKFRPILEDIDKQLCSLEGGLNLMSYLIMPVQRIPRYQLLLRSLIKASSEGHPRWTEMQEAHVKLGQIGAYINESKGKRENMQKMMDICDRFKGLPNNMNLVVPHRKLVKEGILTVFMTHGFNQKSSMKICQRHAYLFNDLLIICKSDGVAFKGSLTLSSATVENKEDSADFSVSTAKSAFGFRVPDKKVRNEWIDVILDCIERGKKIRNSKRKIKGANNRSFTKRDHSVHNLILTGLKDMPLGKKSPASQKKDSVSMTAPEDS